jgi:hypothetical protein
LSTSSISSSPCALRLIVVEGAAADDVTVTEVFLDDADDEVLMHMVKATNITVYLYVCFFRSFFLSSNLCCLSQEEIENILNTMNKVMDRFLLSTRECVNCPSSSSYGS